MLSVMCGNGVFPWLTALCVVQILFSNEPVEVPKDETKPFEVTVNDTLIYSHCAPLSGEKGPILFEDNKWWGAADPSKVTLVEDKITAAM